MNVQDKTRFYIGIDVGTGSVRGAVVDDNGKIYKTATEDITTWNPQPDYYLQSTEDIWRACCCVIKKITCHINTDQIRGIGFDATCSLAVFDTNEKPLSVMPSGDNKQNVILWMDHRAAKEADIINATNHSVLMCYGGKLSLENQPPKLLWLKQNMKDDFFKNVGHFFDLPDFLTWKATGSLSRSLCSLVCKWGYTAKSYENHGWDATFWETIGLGELTTDNFSKIGNLVQYPGQPCKGGLSLEAAQEINLKPGIAVGTSIIDAHCGGIGLMGCNLMMDNDSDESLTKRLALICGTSTCHMAISKEALLVKGIWGPYFSAMIPGLWLNEGGQSASGKLIDHIIETHPAAMELKKSLKASENIYQLLNDILEKLQEKQKLSSVCYLTENLHIWPDFHGNRSPIADPTLTGMVSGLTLASDREDLAKLYLATIQALVYGTRHIITTLTEAGHKFTTLLICGGLGKNKIFVQSHADALGIPITTPTETESVLLGGAILGACAAQDYNSITTAAYNMCGTGDVTLPDCHNKSFHDRKYQVFLKMLQHQQEYRNIMLQP